MPSPPSNLSRRFPCKYRCREFRGDQSSRTNEEKVEEEKEEEENAVEAREGDRSGPVTFYSPPVPTEKPSHPQGFCLYVKRREKNPGKGAKGEDSQYYFRPGRVYRFASMGHVDGGTSTHGSVARIRPPTPNPRTRGAATDTAQRHLSQVSNEYRNLSPRHRGPRKRVSSVG